MNRSGVTFALAAAAAPWLAAAAGSPGAPTAQNFAAAITINSVELRPAYGGERAGRDRQFAVLSTTWVNRIDPQLAEARGLAPGYGVDDLAQHLFLVVDGRMLGVLRPGLAGAGRASLGSVMLPKPGAKVDGDVVFEIPAAAPASLDLRFYDDIAGDMAASLRGPAPAVRPLLPPQRNAVGEFAVFGFEDPAAGAAAPPGFRAVAVELRARSTWTNKKEAPGYDAAREPGTQIDRVNLLDWPEVRTYLHVLADGVHACALADDAAVPDLMRFIPEFFTGRRMVFLVPADAKSLELFCAMPHAATDDGTLDLAPLRFPLTAKVEPRPPLATGLAIQDEMFRLRIAARRTASFAGEPAGDDKVFVVLDVEVVNSGRTGEFFQPPEQLALVDADGSDVAADAITSRGSRRPEGDKVHLPAGERRRFELAYRVDARLAPVKLSFHGGEFAQTYDLPVAP